MVILPGALASAFTMAIMGRSVGKFDPLIIRGVGLGLVFVPLTNLSMQGLPMSRIPAGTTMFNLMRQLGGSVGIALSATLVSRFTAENHAALALHLSRYDGVARERIAALTQLLLRQGSPLLIVMRWKRGGPSTRGAAH